MSCTSTTVGRRPRGGAPSPPSRCPAGQRRNAPTLTLRCHAPWSLSRKLPLPNPGRKNSCPDGWLHAGAKVPIRLTVRQEQYCRRAIDIHRFCYNLAVRTHRFCRRNRLPWPSWMDISKAFNACKREDHPFVTDVAAIVATGAFRDFGQAVDNWRNPGLRARVPKNQAPGRSPAPVPS